MLSGFVRKLSSIVVKKLKLNPWLGCGLDRFPELQCIVIQKITIPTLREKKIGKGMPKEVTF